MIEKIKNLDWLEKGLLFILVFIILPVGITLLAVFNFKPKENLTVSITPEEELRQRLVIEKNEKWFEGYKQGQIDAIKGYVDFELKKNDNGETVWEFVPKRRYNK